MLTLLRIPLETSSTAAEVPDPALVTAGSLGAVFFFGLGLAVFLLWRNMNSRLKRLDEKGSLPRE